MEASKDTTNLRLTITVFYMMLQSAEAFVSQMGRVYPLQIGMSVHIAQLLEKLGPACGIIFPAYAEVKVGREGEHHLHWIGFAVGDCAYDNIWVFFLDYLEGGEYLGVEMAFCRVVTFSFPCRVYSFYVRFAHWCLSASESFLDLKK